jgi:RNA polymerase sigma-70 factor (ECF subfamily)
MRALFAPEASRKVKPTEAGPTRLYLVGSQALREAPDAELVAAFVRGDVRAPGALWDRFYPLVRRVLSRAMGPNQDVEDLLQETFLRLYRKLPAVRDPASLKSFVLSIATRVVQTELRVRWFRRWLGLFEDGELPDQAAVDTDMEARQALDRFYQLLDGLNGKHRTAFVLRYVEGLELTDVAEALGVSLATIKRWLPRIAKRVFSQAGRDPILKAYILHEETVVVVHG